MLSSKMNRAGYRGGARKGARQPHVCGSWVGLLFRINSPFPLKSITLRDLQWDMEDAQQKGRIRTTPLHSLIILGIDEAKVCTNFKCYLERMFNSLESWYNDRDPCRALQAMSPGLNMVTIK